MKKKLLGISLISLGLVNAQVIIGDETGTATNKTSVLLDFASNQKKGIILPYVKTNPVSPTEGTILLDASNPINAKIVFYNGAWQDLSSGNRSNINNALSNQPNVTEDSAAKAIIGASSSSANGVLVLESDNKAMILPKVASTDDIVNPAPGMMVYINKTNAKRLAVFNGNKWTFWAAN